MFEKVKCGDREVTTCVLDKQSIGELLRMIVATNEAVVRVNEALVSALKVTPSEVAT